MVSSSGGDDPIRRAQSCFVKLSSREDGVNCGASLEGSFDACTERHTWFEMLLPNTCVAQLILRLLPMPADISWRARKSAEVC